MKNKKTIKIILLSLVLVICVAILGGAYWILSYSKATDHALLSLASSSQVSFSDSTYLTFEPIPNNNKTGIIFYPGGKVDPKAYAPLASSLAESGYTVVITPMPLNLAVLNINAADGVIAKFPNIKNWIIAGHSLGGSMAVKYYNQSKNPNIKAIILLAAYPDTADDISKSDVKVLSLYGSLDNVLNKTSLENTKKLLPSTTVFTEIAGGNHGQFGDYGMQSGDNPAIITNDKQRELTVADINNFIQSFNL